MENRNDYLTPTPPSLVDIRVTKLFDEEIEKALLGTLISIEGLYLEYKDRLSADLFHVLKWKDLFSAVKAIGDSGDFPNMVVVTNKLNELHITTVQAYDVAMICEYSSASNIGRYITILQDLSSRRSLWQQGMKLASDVVDISKPLNQIIKDHATGMDQSIYNECETSIYSLDSVLTDVANTIWLNQNDATRKRGAMTGFRRIDEKGGWQPSNLIIVAADSSQGKSSFALNTAISAMEGGQKIAFYSLEMTREQLVSRILSAKTGIPSNSILWDKLTPSEYNSVMQHIEQIRYKIGNSLYFDDKSSSGLDQILNSIRKQRIKYGITGVVVDYMQILNVNDKNSQSAARKMGDAARAFKNLAKELGIWILSLSQLSRDRENPVPTMARLRDSGEIAEAADIILLIYRPEIYGKRYPEPFSNKSVVNTAMIDICKGRNIGLFKFLVSFDPRRCYFSDPDFPIPEYTTPVATEDSGSGFYNKPDF